MVAKRPWMPLYIADYLADTQHLSITESGAYLHLIMAYWQYEELHANAHALSRICRMTLDEWGGIEPVLARFFTVTETHWIHHRIEAELAKTKRISKARREAANIRHGKTDANSDASGDANSGASADANARAENSIRTHTSHLTLHIEESSGPDSSPNKESPPTPPRRGKRGGGQLDLQNGSGSKPLPEGDDRAELFTLGRRLLGEDADPLINRLIRSKGSIAEALQVMHGAKGAKNAHSYVAAAAIRGPPPAELKKPGEDDRYLDPRL